MCALKIKLCASRLNCLNYDSCQPSIVVLISTPTRNQRRHQDKSFIARKDEVWIMKLWLNLTCNTHAKRQGKGQKISNPKAQTSKDDNFQNESPQPQAGPLP